jgi:DNA-directed RNA polymerase subunit RPC12/RpoP
VQQPIIRTFVLSELKCYMCGATADTVEHEQGDMAGYMKVQKASRLRCPRCGGSLYIDEVDRIDRRFEPVEWEDDGPRRGRPPKWLVEQRRRKLLAAQAS